MDLATLKARHDAHIARVRTNRGRVLTFTTPCCVQEMETQVPKMDETWDTFSTCVYCGRIFWKVSSQHDVKCYLVPADGPPPVQPADLTDPERIALDRVGDSDGSIATHWIAKRLGTDCAKARRILKRLEKRGLVEGVAAPRSGLVFWWKITAAGRQALAAIGSD